MSCLSWGMDYSKICEVYAQLEGTTKGLEKGSGKGSGKGLGKG